MPTIVHQKVRLSPSGFIETWQSLSWWWLAIGSRMMNIDWRVYHYTTKQILLTRSEFSRVWSGLYSSAHPHPWPLARKGAAIITFDNHLDTRLAQITISSVFGQQCYLNGFTVTSYSNRFWYRCHRQRLLAVIKAYGCLRGRNKYEQLRIKYTVSDTWSRTLECPSSVSPGLYCGQIQHSYVCFLVLISGEAMLYASFLKKYWTF